MTLTLAHGPLSGSPPETVNYRVDGPRHRLLLHPFPRRIRGLLGGEVVVDSQRACLLHETGHLPQLYVPRQDVRDELLRATDHTTHCPFKGDASYWSVEANGSVAENAVWSYLEPLAEAEWLRGYLAFYFKQLDAWYDEDEEVVGHVRDPYHRVDVRGSSRHVRVLAGDTVVAETDRPKLLSETGLPNRFYVPPDDVRRDLLEPSATHSVCPYKGVASYHSLRVGDELLEDAVFFYPDPLENALKARGHLSFTGEGIAVEVDGERVE
jgi:uncharacterized protein (DUF427 family)